MKLELHTPESKAREVSPASAELGRQTSVTR